MVTPLSGHSLGSEMCAIPSLLQPNHLDPSKRLLPKGLGFTHLPDTEIVSPPQQLHKYT
jgi:hypothetical protein